MPKPKKEDVVKKIQSRNQERKLSLDTTSAINEEERKIPFIIVSKNNEGERRDWWTDEVFIEKLDVNGASYERLKTFFKDHRRSVDDAVGKVENIRLEDGELKCDVIFGTDEDSEKIFRKYVDGILTDCSIGYRVNAATIEERKDAPDVVTITEFEIFELSAVGIGFDSGATVGRNNQNSIGENDMNEKLRAELVELRKRVNDLDEKEQVRLKELEDMEKAETVDANAIATRAKAEERQRSEYIYALVSAGEINQERAIEFIKGGQSMDQVRKAILDDKVNNSRAPQTRENAPTERVEMMRGIEDAILMRCGFTPANVAPTAERFSGASLLDMARVLTNYEGYDKNELVKRAMTTADFPLLLGNIANRVLAASFDEDMGTFDLWTEAVDLKDFKTVNEVKLSNQNGRLKKVKELSEKKKIEFAEDGEAWALESYGVEFAFTREMIINDDLSVLTGIVAEFGRMAKRTANGLVYDFLQRKGDYANYVMSDGKALFEATVHKNLTASGSALDSATLSAARTTMRRQKDGEKALNISPKFLIVAPEAERTALQLLNSEADVGSTNSGVTNPHKNSLTPIIESELEGTAWYLAAGRNTIKVGYLQGTNRQPVVEQKNSDIDGVKFKCVFDFGVTVTDFRGLYKNNGAA